MKKKLTVCVTTLNRWSDCNIAVQSLLAQASNINMQIIVVDDSSTDPINTELFDQLIEKGHKYIRHDKNKGLSAARNTAIREADGYYFSFCDDDDQWPNGLASRLVSAFDSAPESVGMIIALSEKLKANCCHLFQGYPRLTELMRNGLTPPVGSQVYRTGLLRQVGGYRQEVFSGVDHDLWISLSSIDPRVGVSWGEAAVVGNNPSHQRLTTVENRRRAEIDKSLSIWRDNLIDVFGQQFYRHFVFSYNRYLDYSFFVKSFQKREYFDIGLRVIKSPWLFIEVIKRFWNRILGKTRCTLFPKYTGD